MLSRRALGSAPDPDEDARDTFLWVFLVPALDEDVTIADSVSRLLAVEARNKAILVIDDGSTDGTAAVLGEFDTPELEVLHRVAPEARQGKHAALNAAWRHLDRMLTSGRWSGWPRDRVIVCVVDADGRLDPAAPRFAASHFTDDRVGGLQILVRIYNRVQGAHVVPGRRVLHFRAPLSRPAERRTARPRWAATGSSTACRPSTRSPTKTSAARGAPGSPRTRT